MKENLKIMKTKGENMRKNFIKMMVVAGAAALIIPTAAMAEWDQAETHWNQKDHNAAGMAFDDTGRPAFNDYGKDSMIGYDTKGDGTATTLHTYKWLAAPDYTTPCPISYENYGATALVTNTPGNCPSQTVSWDNDQTGEQYGWANDDNEIYGVILDDLYQKLSETASVDSSVVGDTAFKKVDQVLDILFYRANTEGEVVGRNGWYDNGGSQDGTHWYAGFGIDQTLDQDVADVHGTSNNPAVGNPCGQDLWGYDHVAQTFYQDFSMWDKNGNTQMMRYGSGVDSATAKEIRTRHGLEILNATCGNGEGGEEQSTVVCDYDSDDGEGTSTPADAEYGEISVDAADFAYFDQWVIQSIKDEYTKDNYDLDGTPGGQTADGTFTLEQSYSSWMVQGEQGILCDAVNDLTGGGCIYIYGDGHEVEKSIANPSVHQTGDP